MMTIKFKFFLIYVILIGVCILGGYLFQTSYAYSYDINDVTLFFDNDKDNMEEKIKIYLEDIDDLLVVNSSFEYSDMLVYNYDFLLHFSLGYIFEHQEYYSDKLKVMETFSYMTKELVKKATNQYVSVEEIYEITDKYFGIRDFEIINDNVNIVNNYVSLIQYTENKFNLNIQNVEVEFDDTLIYAKVFYEYDNCYLYTFENKDQVLKIKNIEVVL